MNATMFSLGQVLSMAIAIFCFSIFYRDGDYHTGSLSGTHDQCDDLIFYLYLTVHRLRRDLILVDNDPQLITSPFLLKF